MRLILLSILWFVIGVIVGSLVRPISAQADPTLYKVGSRLTLAFVGDRFAECNVAEIRGPLIRCEDSKIQWFNTDNAISLTVR
jgi:hypothetical protein